MTDKRRPMPDIPQDIFELLLRGEKNEKSRKRSQAMVKRVQDNETLRYFAAGTGEAMTETDIRQLPPGKLLCMMDGENPLLVDRWPGPG